jgi:PAS domain-containing protein
VAGYVRGAARGATGGLGNLAAALAQGQQTQRQAYDAELGLQSKLAQALSEIGANDAAADKTRAETAFLANRPDLYEEQAALAAGVDIPTLQAFRQTLRGQRPQVPMGPPTADGEMGAGAIQFDPATSTRLAQALQRFAPVVASGAPIAANDWASALDKFRDQDLSSEVLAGTRPAADVGRAQAAMAGKPLFSVDAAGQVVDLFRGAADASGPVPQSRVGLTRSQEAENEAQRQRALAEADRARAEAARARAEGGGPKPPQGYRFKADGTMEPIPGGPADPRVKREGQRTGMSPTLQKELIEADDTAQAARTVVGLLQSALAKNDQAYSGYFAKERARLRSNLPGQSPEADATIELDNIMTGQALESLKAIFGGMPTEGERKILLEMQASADKTPKQRADIMRRAIALAQRRGVYATNKAKAIRSGTYLEQDPAAAEAAPAAAPAAAGGWKIERVN